MTAVVPERVTEDGYTLIEMIIAVMILGLTIVGIVGALGATVVASDVHRRQADASTVLISAGEAIKDATRNPYVNCAVPGTYNPVLGVTFPPSGRITPAMVSVTNVAYWDGGTSFNNGLSACGDLAGLNNQLITVQVKDPVRSVTLTLDIVKRKP